MATQNAACWFFARSFNPHGLTPLDASATFCLTAPSVGDAVPGGIVDASPTLNQALNRLVMRIAVRADQLPKTTADKTFVTIPNVTDSLERFDHQVVYGRRGAGKTHAFRHLASTVTRAGDISIYVDLRTVGSNGGMYGDSEMSLPERGTQLLIDVLESVHRELLRCAIESSDFPELLEHLDPLAEAATSVRVEGPVTVSRESSAETGREDTAGWAVSAATTPTSASAGVRRGKGGKSSSKASSRVSVERSGKERPRVLFGRLAQAFAAATAAIEPRRIWLLLDEWSTVPLDLQPLLADMLRRSMFPCRGITVKIGAIERRSMFKLRGTDSANYLGIELGADTAGALDLDEHLVAGSDRGWFFSEVLYRHLAAMMLDEFERQFAIPSSSVLATTLFDKGALGEFVRAAEGVPRDALQIASLAAQHAGARPISVESIQNAARKFYLQDKETGIAGNRAASDVWVRLQKEVVAGRRSRTFLIKRNRERTHAGILDLYDARLIHLLQPGLATSADPGVLYDGYCLDYGSYVNLLKEAELDGAWNASGRPWEVRGGEPFLPDRFDESAIFDPQLIDVRRSTRPRRQAR